MPTATEPRIENPLGLDLGPYNEVFTRAQDVSLRVMDGLKATGLTSLDAYDKVVQTLTDLQLRMAEASQVDWLAAQTRAQATFVRDMNAACTNAARAVLA